MPISQLAYFKRTLYVKFVLRPYDTLKYSNAHCINFYFCRIHLATQLPKDMIWSSENMQVCQSCQFIWKNSFGSTVWTARNDPITPIPYTVRAQSVWESVSLRICRENIGILYTCIPPSPSSSLLTFIPHRPIYPEDFPLNMLFHNVLFSERKKEPFLFVPWIVVIFIFQVIRYQEKQHYHCHFDSEEEEAKDAPCCHQSESLFEDEDDIQCVPCRWASNSFTTGLHSLTSTSVRVL